MNCRYFPVNWVNRELGGSSGSGVLRSVVRRSEVCDFDVRSSGAWGSEGLKSEGPRSADWDIDVWRSEGPGYVVCGFDIWRSEGPRPDGLVSEGPKSGSWCLKVRRNAGLRMSGVPDFPCTVPLDYPTLCVNFWKKFKPSAGQSQWKYSLQASGMTFTNWQYK